MAKIQTKVKTFLLASSLLGEDNPESGKNFPKLKFSDDTLQASFSSLIPRRKKRTM